MSAQRQVSSVRVAEPRLSANAAVAFPKITKDCLEAIVPATNPSDTFDIIIRANNTSKLFQADLVYGSLADPQVAARGWFSMTPELALEMLLRALCSLVRETFKTEDIKDGWDTWGGTIDRTLL